MKKKHLCNLLVCWLIFQSLAAQELQITGVFEPKDQAAAYIAVLGNSGQQNILGESKVVNGEFSISLPQNTPQGVYKLAFGMQEKVYFYWVHTAQKKYEFVFKKVQNDWRMECFSSNEHEYLTQYIKKQDSLMEAMSVLYYFSANYPEKQSKLFTEAQRVLQQKTQAFIKFRTNAIVNAPKYSQEILTQTQVFLYNPLWYNATLEENFEATFYDYVPEADTSFYKKPFFGDKLEQFFSFYLDNKVLSEAEKYEKIKKRVLLSIDKLSHHPQKNFYYNLMVRYFTNAQYPFVISLIDAAIDPTKMLTAEDVLFYQYRQDQATLFGKTAPKIPTSTGGNFLDQASSKQKVVVFVGGNTPFSQQGLAQLNEKIKVQKDIQVYAVLLFDSPESIQNFKVLFPNWLHHAATKEGIESLAKAYYLHYTPTIFILDENNVIVSAQKMFE